MLWFSTMPRSVRDSSSTFTSVGICTAKRHKTDRLFCQPWGNQVMQGSHSGDAHNDLTICTPGLKGFKEWCVDNQLRCPLLEREGESVYIYIFIQLYIYISIYIKECGSQIC